VLAAKNEAKIQNKKESDVIAFLGRIFNTLGKIPVYLGG
jgi:hypothetical protein